MGEENTVSEYEYPSEEEIGNRNSPQNDEHPPEGAMNEEELTAEELPPEKLAEMQLTVEESRMVANAKKENRDIMQAAVNEQLAKLEKISNASYKDERVRHLDFNEAKEKFDQLSTALFMLDLAAEDAAYQAGQQEKRYKRACAIAAGEEPEAEEEPAINQEYPDQDQLREEDERKKSPILDEGDLDALRRDAEGQKKDAESLRDALGAVQKRINNLNKKAREIIDRLGYYTDERHRALDLSDIDAELAKQEQIAQHLTERIEDADDWAQKLYEAYEQAKVIAEESKLSENLEFPEQDEVLNKQTEPDEQEIQNEVDAPELAKYKQIMAKVEAAKERYTDARMAIVSLSQYIEILKTKSLEEQQGKGGIIPMDVAQNDLEARREKLPQFKRTLEQALSEQKEAEQILAQAKKDHIKWDMSDTLREHWDKVCEANRSETFPIENAPAQYSGLSVHIGKLYGAFSNRHDSQEWTDMLKALGELNIEAHFDRWRESAGDYHYDSKEMGELRRQVDYAIEKTQKYVDYKQNTLLVKFGIGQGSEYLREAQGALGYLTTIQDSLNEMDKQYQKCAQAADERYDPKPPKKSQVDQSQQRKSFSRRQPNPNRNMGGFGPHM